jgi:uncharacterized protein YjiS (DUF1127 family)
MPARTATLLRLPQLLGYLPRMLPWLVQALALRRQRAHLRRLDDHLLRDIGLTRDDAMHEGTRPFWDAPTPWHRPDGRPGRR